MLHVCEATTPLYSSSKRLTCTSIYYKYHDISPLVYYFAFPNQQVFPMSMNGLLGWTSTLHMSLSISRRFATRNFHW